MLKRIVGFVFLVLVAIIVVALLRTFSYGGGASAGADIELPAAPAFQVDRAAQHLSEAIQFKTVTFKGGDPAPDAAGPWLELHDWLATTYPRVHAELTKRIVADYSLLFEWQGSDPSLDPLILMAHQDVCLLYTSDAADE